MPRNLRTLAYRGIHAGGDAARRPDGKCHREYTAIVAAFCERRVWAEGHQKTAAVTDRRYSGKGEKVV